MLGSSWYEDEDSSKMPYDRPLSLGSSWYEDSELFRETSDDGLCGFRGGSWWLFSPSDSRWNRSGKSFCVGGFAMPMECSDALEKMKKMYGEPPDDLEYGYMKD